MLSPMFVWSRAASAFVMLLAIGVASISLHAAPGDWSVEPKNIGLVDAEQPDETGGLIALYPRAGDAQTLAIPGGEPADYLHLSLVYLGDDIAGVAEGEFAGPPIRQSGRAPAPDRHSPPSGAADRPTGA